MRPFLKWLGNKHSSLHKIQIHLPQAQRLIEPFTGSAAIFLATNYSSYLLGEQNKDLITLYKILAKDGEKFIKKAKIMFDGSHNNETDYYQCRQEFNASENLNRKAILFLYLNRHGYNGLCRYNGDGGYNVPFGRYVKPYFPEKELLFFYEKTKNAEFVVSDFKKTMRQATSGDVIYCDPPYVPLSASASFTAYTQKGFGEKQQQALVSLAETIVNKNITIIISNHDTELTREYYKNASLIQSFPVKRVLSCKGNKRKPVEELLAIYTP
tara:strand:+ start:97 stop:903 length:807 start_codon:yes stop_codon:yes gene_type:complete